MRLTSRVADGFGRRDWVENASVKVYNALALLRGRKVGKGELLLLIPRCLSKETLDGVFPAVPYCIDLIGGPYIETDEAVCKAFRPKSAVRPSR